MTNENYAVEVVVAKERATTAKSMIVLPIDPFVVEWFATKAKEQASELGKPKGKIVRVIIPHGKRIYKKVGKGY
ncbi:hypothetical protein HYZ64_03130 [Candidatus Berkelbacteria bacterium]|nr:hypothetical protein [Candidatus Berkelbacteria bacterium]